MVLDQHADEAFERADDGPVQHYRGFPARILGHVLGSEAPGHEEIDLHGADLPGAADRVLEVVFDLGTVEGPLPRQFLPWRLTGLETGPQGVLRARPEFVVADALVRPQGDLERDVGEAEVGIDRHGLAMEGHDLGLDLGLGAEDVAVVLGEAAHAQQPVQRSRGLHAVAGAELAVAQRQLAVAVQAVVVDLHVARAVHRLDRVVAVLRRGLEHVVAVVLPVPGALPQRDVEHQRAAHLVVAGGAVHPAHVLLHHLPDRPTPRVPEHQARGFLLHVEQVQRLADLAVVALLGFLDLHEVGLELLVAEPGGAVDALQLRVLLVAAPVGARHPHQLEGTELGRVGHVRAAAQVDPLALAVERDLLARRDDVVDDRGLELLALALEEGDRGVLGHHAARHRQRLGHDAPHLVLDPGQVLGRERGLAREVVVEAVLDHRADRDLGVGEQALRGLRQQMRGGVAHDLERIGVLDGDDLERGIAFDGV